MKLRSVLVLIAVMMFVAGCAPTEEEPAAPTVDLAAEEQAVRAVSARWLELARARDAAGIAALFTASGSLFREDGEPLIGPDAIEAFIAGDLEDNPSLIVTFGPDRVEIAGSGDLAVEYGNWNVTGAGPDGTDTDQGNHGTIYRRVDGEWKV